MTKNARENSEEVVPLDVRPMADRLGTKVSGDYQNFVTLVKRRHSTRRFKVDPLPEGYPEKILEVACWAMFDAVNIYLLWYMIERHEAKNP